MFGNIADVINPLKEIAKSMSDILKVLIDIRAELKLANSRY